MRTVQRVERIPISGILLNFRSETSINEILVVPLRGKNVVFLFANTDATALELNIGTV